VRNKISQISLCYGVLTGGSFGWQCCYVCLCLEGDQCGSDVAAVLSSVLTCQRHIANSYPSLVRQSEDGLDQDATCML
jgi:hypothetical protein